MSINPNITWDIIQANPKKSWDWYEISRHPNITWDIIINDLNKPSYLKFIYPSKPWDWDGISKNPSITWDIIQANPDRTWSKYWLEKNKFTAQANISMTKHQLKAHQESNYLARYICYSLITISLEYGY